MRTPRPLLRAIVAVALAALLTGIVVDASGKAPRQAGSNLLSNRVFVATLPPGGRLCQQGLVPGDTAAVRMLIGTYGRPGPPLTAQVRAAGGTVAAGTLKAGWTQGLAAVPVSRVRRTLPFATVCVTNRGGVKLAIAGAPTAPAQAPLVAGVRQQGAVRFEYLRPGRESWWDLLPTIFHRFGLGKSHWLGGWTLALAGLLVLIGSAIAVRSLLREESL